jgi:hypothetical protein
MNEINYHIHALPTLGEFIYSILDDKFLKGQNINYYYQTFKIGVGFYN